MRPIRYALAVFALLVVVRGLYDGDSIGALFVGFIAYLLWPKKKRTTRMDGPFLS